MNALLITGTDTDAGKTVLVSSLLAYWQKYCPSRTLGIMKPVQSGVGDREHYSRLFQLDPDEVNPICFAAPLAPPLAAAQVGQRVELDVAWRAFDHLRRKYDWVLVEALGGLGSPVTFETTVADLAWDWRLPAVLVVPVKLGAICQAVANVALARMSRVHLKGIVLNCPQPVTTEEIDQWAPADLIQSLTGVPVLGLVPYLSDPLDLDKLVQVAADLEIDRLLPIAW